MEDFAGILADTKAKHLESNRRNLAMAFLRTEEGIKEHKKAILELENLQLEIKATGVCAERSADTDLVRKLYKRAGEL